MPELAAPPAPAAPAAPAPAAAAPSAPAPTAPAPSAPATASVTASEPTPASIARDTNLSTEEKIHQGWEAAKATVPLETEEEPAAAQPPAAVPGEGEKPEDAVAAAAQPGEEKPAGEPKPGEQPASAAATEEVDFGDVGSIDSFNSFLQNHADVKAALDKPENAPIKSMVYGALRRDQENREIRSLVPDVETAKTAVQAAGHWNTFDSGFLSATTPDGVKGFLNKMAQMAVEYDASGQPIVENGAYKMHPAFPAILNHIGNNKVSILREEMQKSGKLEGPVAEIFSDGLKVLEAQAKNLSEEDGERLQVALDVIRGVLPAAPAKVDEPQDVKDARAAVKAKEDALNRQQSEQREATHRQSVDRAEETASKRLVDQLKPVLARFGLQGQVLEDAKGKIGTALDEALAGNALYQSRYDSIERRLEAETDPARREVIEKELTNHVLLYASQLQPVIAAKIGREYANPVIAKQDERDKKIAGQVNTSRTDPRATSVNTSPGKPQDAKSLRTQIEKDWTAAHPNEDMPAGHMIREMSKRSGVFAKK